MDASSPSPSPPKCIPLKPQQSFKILDRILTTVHEMLIDRGYTIEHPSTLTEQFAMEDLKTVAHCKKYNDRVFVYFATDIKVPVKKIREYVVHMESNQIRHAIIVYAQQVTPGAKTELNQKFDIELFRARELFENPTRHCLVPRHELIQTEQEVQRVMTKFHIKSKNDFPIIYTSDVVIRYYHWPVGSIVRIFRTLGGLREPEIYYRHVKQ